MHLVKKIVSAVVAASIVLSVPAVAPASATEIKHINNSALRFGDADQESLGATGLLEQPFYWNGSSWRKLTHGVKPLDLSFGYGTSVATSTQWNQNTVYWLARDSNTLVNHPAQGLVRDYSGLTASSLGGWGEASAQVGFALGGNSVQFNHDYSLGQTDDYIRIETSVTNLSSATLTSASIWVGTRDDFVGGSDQPKKTRGSIDSSGFTKIATASSASNAIKIESGSEGVLFYSVSPGAASIINSCCSFTNVTRQNPATSSIETTGDGSYGMYFPLGDLAPGATASVVWFYAAGTIQDLDSVVNQVAAAGAAEAGLDSVTTTGGVLSYEFNYGGTAYWMVVPRGSAAPTSAQIIAGANYGAVMVSATGNGPVVANTERTFTLSGLSEATQYTVYTTTQYDDPDNPGTNISSTPESLDFSTLVDAPTVTITSGSQQVSVDITPSSNETNYQYSINGGATWITRSPASTASPWVISGLTNGTSYDFQFRGVFDGAGGVSTSVVSVTPAAGTASVSLSYASQVAPLAAMPTLDKGGSSGAATYSLLTYSGSDPAPGCAVNSSTGAVSVTGPGECRIGVVVAGTADYLQGEAEAIVAFTKSADTITWTSPTVTVRSPAGVDRTVTMTLNPDYPVSSNTQYELEIKLGDVVKIPFNSPNSQRVGYSSYFKCPSVIGWDQSVMFPFTGSGDSFYYLRARNIGVCNEARDQNNQRVPASQFLSLPQNLYTTPLSPGIRVTVVKGDQQPISVVGSTSAAFGQTVTLDATGGSGIGARSYAVTGTGCSITTVPLSFGGRTYAALASAELTKTGAGACDVTVTKAGDNNFEPITSAPFTVTFGQGNQEISFTSAVPTNPVPGGSYTPTATASSGLAVTIAATGTCTETGGVVTFTTSGACTITASQAGDTDYLAATNITQVIEVGIRNQTISFASISDKEFGDPAFRIGPTSSETNLTVALSSADASKCTVDANGIVVLLAAGTCTIHADQAGTVGVVAAASRVSRSFQVYPAGSSAPFIMSVSRGLGALTATLIPPSYTGGATITRYEVQAFDANGDIAGFNNNCTVAIAPAPQKCTVEGLTEGVNYTLRARAHHTGGVGSLSPASAAYAPVGNPDAVRELTAVADNTSLTITWLAPLDLGGATFTRYDVYIKLASENSFPGTPSHVVNSVNAGSYEFTGLVNGESYDVKMVTITSVDTTEVVSNSALVSQVPFTTPNAVRDLTAIEVGDDIFISWRYPAFDGGRPVQSYDVDVNSGALTCENITTLFCTVTKGAETNFVVSTTADNPAGTGLAANFTLALQMPAPPSQNNSGGVFVPPAPTIPALSTPALDEQLPIIEAGESIAVELDGTNLNLITRVSIGSLSLRFEVVSNQKIRVILPSRAPGTLRLILSYQGGQLEQSIRVQSASDKIVNAGSFKGVVALYAKGYLGQRLSAKVGEDWVIVERLTGDFVRVTDRTRWVGKPLKVRIFIDRKLVRIVDVVTR